jgi:hypothetical protein
MGAGYAVLDAARHAGLGFLTPVAGRTGTRALPEGGIWVDLLSPLPPGEAADRVRSLVRDRLTIESSESVRSSRRLQGSIDGSTVLLAVRDDNIVTRRKSWNVEFAGEITPTAGGSMLRGAIDVPDRRELDILMWAFRIAGIMAAVLIVALQARDGLDPSAVGFAAVILAITWIATRRMRATGLKCAADDAALLLQRLRSTLSTP